MKEEEKENGASNKIFYLANFNRSDLEMTDLPRVRKYSTSDPFAMNSVTR